MGQRGRALVVTAACAVAVAACSSGRSSANSHSTRATSSSTVPPTTGARSSTTTRPSPTTATTTKPQTLLQALLADGRNADIKIVYDTPSGRATLIRRNGDSVYADGAGVRFTLGTHSYDCTGSGDGASCTPIQGNATLSDVDVYTALVADALAAPSYLVHQTTGSILGRTAECVSILGRQTAHAGQSVSACIDDETGALLRFSTLGAPSPGPKLYAVSVSAPTDADFQLPVPATAAP